MSSDPLAEAEEDARKLEGWRCCTACRRDWVPYQATDDDKAVSELCGFDVVRALNLLLEAVHANDAKPARRAAALDAHMHIFHVQEGLGHERLSETEYLAAIVSCRAALDPFLKTAIRRERLEAELEAHTVGSRARPRPVELTRGARRLGTTMDRYLRALERKWSFTSDGRTLPGTRRRRGAKRRALLGEVERVLSDGGFSHPEIAQFDFDGSLRVGREAAAEQRVRDRLRASRRGA